MNEVYNKLLSGSGVSCLGECCSLICFCILFFNVEGKGRLLDAHTVHVSFAIGGERRITGKNILIATGSKAVKLDIPGKVQSKSSVLGLDVFCDRNTALHLMRLWLWRNCHLSLLLQ